MMKIPYYFVLIYFVATQSMLYAGDIEKGKEKSATCVACHGNAGISLNPEWPKLAGQHAKYLETQLYEFQKGPDGSRNNAIMYGIALALSEEDIQDISAYYASLENSIGLTDDSYLEDGQNIYRGGNMEYKIQACMACHGPNGQGNSLAGIPSLSGQHSEYIYQQLKKFQSTDRANDYNKMMRNIASRMSDEEMKAVAKYIEGLY